MNSMVKPCNLILTLILIVASIIGVSAGGVARAEADSVSARYEAQNVWMDLQEATFEGEKIDLSIYNFDERKQPQIISFVELCYSFYHDMQGDYGLYVYVYNPKGEDFTKNEELNKIQFRYGGSDKVSFRKYTLKYLNRSEEAGFEGLFYKFKVTLTGAERAAVLDGINSAERVYEVSGIELYNGVDANSTEYKVSNKYTYTGYAEGYGSKTATTDTLNCKCEGMDVTLTLDVHPTCYMPEGTEGTNNYTSDCLHSVYFSIPNKILEKYGGLAAVHATWLNAKTKPIYVTGNKEIYNSYKRVAEPEMYKGDLSDYLSDGNELNYAFLVNAVRSLVIEPLNYYTADMAFNMNGVMANTTNKNLYGYAKESDDVVIKELPLVIYAENGDADTYTVQGEKLLEYMREYSSKISYLDPVAGRYYRGLFESIDEKYTEKNIEAEDTYSLTTQNTSQHWWEWLLGVSGTHVEFGETFDNIKAIQPITDEDFKNKSVKEICNDLYISENDYAQFSAYYTAAKAAQKTTFLFRFYQSKYESREVMNFELVDTNLGYVLRRVDTNAFLSQAVVNLNFDIIDVTCRQGGVSTVIACVMSPMDISPDIRPPVHTTHDGPPWWIYVLIIILVIMFVIALCILFPPVWGVLKTILSAFASPFKALGRNISNWNAERRHRKEMLRQEKINRKVQMQIAQYQDKLNRKEYKRRNKLDAKEEAKARKRKAKANKKKRKNKKKGKGKKK